MRADESAPKTVRILPPVPATILTTMSQLTDNYPNAYTDFYSSGTPCVYKSGPSWPVPTGPMARSIFREARPVYGHPIGNTWRSVGNRIYRHLDSLDVKWTSINPLCYANAGEAKPFCPLMLSVGVIPESLLYDDAVAAADVVKEILGGAGFPDIEVAFIESIVTRSVATGPQLLPFDPLDNLPNLRKPFTTALGLSIAPFMHPRFEGTGGLYFRLGKDTNCIALLTCAHVARPPPVYPNTGITRGNESQAREEIIALGNGGYNKAVEAMADAIDNRLECIDIWNAQLGEYTQGGDPKIARRRDERLKLVADAEKEIEELKAVHEEVTRRRAKPEQRVIGFVLHSEEIKLSVGPHLYTADWALLKLYNEMIDRSTFKGNKVYVGGNFSPNNFRKMMFPNPADRAGYRYLTGDLLEAHGVVQDDEIRQPKNLDVDGEKCLFVVKNGLATGTTFGRANGLDSFIREYREYNMKHTSTEIAVFPIDKSRGAFSDLGDSGSVVLARDGRIVGMITSGAGPTDRTDITYMTPYWWLEQQIKSKFPDCFLYPTVE